MAQTLLAVNGTETFPYNLTSNDISEALGLQAGIAAGGYSTSGVVYANASSVTLGNSAYNNVVQVSDAVTSITLPAGPNWPTGAIIHFYPQNSNSSNSYTINAPSGAFIYFPPGNLGDTNTSITVQNVNDVVLLSRGDGEFDVIGGSWVLSNTTAAPFNMSNAGGFILSPLGLIRSNTTSQNFLPNSSFIYGEQEWNVSGTNLTSNVNNDYNYPYINIGNSGTNAEAFTITSNNFTLPNTTEGSTYQFSLLAFNGYNSGNSALSGGTLTAQINFYNSSNSLLGSSPSLTLAAGSNWTFLSTGNFSISSSVAGFAYAQVEITGTTAAGTTSISVSQIKVELGGNGPTFWSDEASQLLLAKTSDLSQTVKTYPYDIAGGANGTLNSSQTVLNFVSPRNVTFPANFSGSVAVAGTAGSGSTTFNIDINGSNVGTLTFAANATTGTFSSTSTNSITLNAGQVINVSVSGTPSANLANVSFTLEGTVS
mgnify:CR=1 FL=1